MSTSRASVVAGAIVAISPTSTGSETTTPAKGARSDDVVTARSAASAAACAATAEAVAASRWARSCSARLATIDPRAASGASRAWSASACSAWTLAAAAEAWACVARSFTDWVSSCTRSWPCLTRSPSLTSTRSTRAVTSAPRVASRTGAVLPAMESGTDTSCCATAIVFTATGGAEAASVAAGRATLPSPRPQPAVAATSTRAAARANRGRYDRFMVGTPRAGGRGCPRRRRGRDGRVRPGRRCAR